MIAAILQRLLFPNVPEYVAFSFAAGTSFVAMLIGTYATKPTDEAVLFEFYKKTRPFGFWGHIRKQIPQTVMEEVNKENKRDIISTFFAVPWQVILFLTFISSLLGKTLVPDLSVTYHVAYEKARENSLSRDASFPLQMTFNPSINRI